MLFGGNANNGTNAGFAYANSRNVPSNSNANIGSRLYFSGKDIETINQTRTAALPLGKKYNIRNRVGRYISDKDYRRPRIRKAKHETVKRYGNLFSKVISIENLRLADEIARKGKTYERFIKQPDGSMKKERVYAYGIRLFDKDKEGNLKRLHDSLADHTFKPSAYSDFIIYEPKERRISRLPYYPDRILHHAIVNILGGIWTRTLTHNTHSCIKGRGIDGCAKQVEKKIPKYEGKSLYCLKIDIKKFYPSMKHDVMKRILRRKIKDKNMLWLLDLIIDSYKDGNPIGNHTSGFFANLYMSGMMHKANEEWKADCVEYADDIVFFSDNKEKLHSLFHEKIRPYIENELKLIVKDNWQVFPIAQNRYDKHGRALDYVGYKFYRKQKLMRKTIKQNFCRTTIKLNKMQPVLPVKAYKQVVASWLGWAKNSNSKHLLKKIIKKEYYESVLRQKAFGRRSCRQRELVLQAEHRGIDVH